MKNFWWIVFLPLLAACEPVNEPQPVLGVSVLAHLIAGESNQRILIYRVQSADDHTPIEDSFIQGLDVTVSNEHFTYEFEVRPDSTLDGLSYQPKETVILNPQEELSLSIRGINPAVFGETTVPGPFHILESSVIKQIESAIVIDAAWTWSRNAHSYSVAIQIMGTFQSQRGILQRSYQTSDSVISAVIEVPFFFSADTCRVIVVGNDKNFTDHISRTKRSTGISAELGFFGASVKREIMLVRE